MKLVTIAVVIDLCARRSECVGICAGPRQRPSEENHRAGRQTRRQSANTCGEGRSACGKGDGKGRDPCGENDGKGRDACRKARPQPPRPRRKRRRRNPNQEARLLAMLPPGTNIQDAALGFKNRGQFIAAVNASTNHNIPFVELKARMTGIPVGSTVPTMPPMSLGQALQSFKVRRRRCAAP